MIDIPRWKLYIWYNILGYSTSPLNIIVEWGILQVLLFSKYREDFDKKKESK